MDDKDTETMTISLPLDSGGFLRRACERCNREFKWLHTPETEQPPRECYHCPYCGQAGDEWTTEEQSEYIKAMALNSPRMKFAFEELHRSIMGLNQEGSFLGLHVTTENLPPSEPEPLQEPDDMRIIIPTCHPSEPIKLLEDWTGSMHCLVCGQIVQA